MSGNLETKLRERLQGQELQAPDLMSSIYQKRSAWYVFMNRVRMNKMKIMAAATLLVALLLTFMQINTKDQPSVANQENLKPSVENSIVVEEPTNIETDQDAVAITNAEEQQQSPETNAYSTTTEESSIDDHSTEQLYTVTQGQVNQTEGNDYEPESETVIEKAVGEFGSDERASENDIVEVTDAPDVTNTMTENSKTVEDLGEEIVQEQETEHIDIPESDVETETSTNTSDEIEIASADSDEAADETSDEVDAGGNNDGDDFSVTDRPRKWAVSLAYGSGIGARAISSSTEGDAVTNRNASESQKLSNSIDLSAYYRLNPHVEAVIGLNYFGRREQLGYTTSTSVQKMNVASRQVIEIHPIYGQRLVTKYDTTYSTVVENEEIKKNNLYHHVTVPVGLRYTEKFTNAPKWSVSLQAQYGLEVASKLNATVLNGLNQEVSLTGQERTNLGHVISAGGALNYHLNSRMIILFEPRATMYLTPMMRSEYRIEQTDRAFTGYIGFKYTL